MILEWIQCTRMTNKIGKISSITITITKNPALLVLVSSPIKILDFSKSLCVVVPIILIRYVL